MKEAPSYEELAERLLDLWQDQVSALAEDQDLADLMRRQFKVASQAGQAAWGMSALTLMQAAGQQMSAARAAQETSDAVPDPAPQRKTDGAQTARSASDDAGGDDVASLLRRIANRLDHIEGRLDALDGGDGNENGRGVPLQSVSGPSGKP